MVAAAGVFPVPAQPKSALDRLALAARHQRRADQRAVVLAPDLLRGAVVEQRQQPGMDADHAIDPGDRHVALAERHLDLEVGRGCPSRSRPSAWVAAPGTGPPPACRRWSPSAMRRSRSPCGARAASAGISARARAITLRLVAVAADPSCEPRRLLQLLIARSLRLDVSSISSRQIVESPADR